MKYIAFQIGSYDRHIIFDTISGGSMRYFILVFLVFSFLSLNLYSQNFPEEFKVNYIFESEAIWNEPDCQKEIFIITTQEFNILKLSEDSVQARYITTNKLPLDFYQNADCSEECSILSHSTVDGLAEFNLYVSKTKSGEYDFELSIEVLQTPVGKVTSSCPDIGVTTHSDSGWIDDFLYVNEYNHNKVQGRTVTYDIFQLDDNGYHVYESNTTLSGEDIGADEANIEQKIHIAPSEPEITSTEITPRKNFLEGTEYPLEFRADVNWAGTPLKDRSAELIIDGNSFPISDLSSSSLSTEINIGNSMFKGTKNGKEYPAEIKISGIDFTKTKEYENDPVIFKPWSNMKISDFKVTRSGKNLIYDYQNTFETNIKLSNSLTSGETVVQISDNPFFANYWGLGNTLPVTIEP